MSFFIGSPAAESTSHVFNDTKDENQIEADEKFNNLLLDQDDFFLGKPLEVNTGSNIASHSSETYEKSSKQPLKTAKVRHVSYDYEVEDTRDLEIVEIQETEKLTKPNKVGLSVAYPTKNTAVRARTMTNRPVKYRKLDLDSISKTSVSDMDKLIEQQLLAALSTQRSEIQRLQAQLNSYIKKYDQSEFQLANTLESLKRLQKKVDHQKLLQSEIDQEFSKLSEIKAGYSDQIRALKAEREALQKQIDTLKYDTSSAHSSYKELDEKVRNISHEIRTGKSPIAPQFL